MAGEKDQLIDETAMEKMSVAPPPEGEEQASEEGSPSTDRSGVADEDPLSAHPT